MNTAYAAIAVATHRAAQLTEAVTADQCERFASRPGHTYLGEDFTILEAHEYPAEGYAPEGEEVLLMRSKATGEVFQVWHVTVVQPATALPPLPAADVAA